MKIRRALLKDAVTVASYTGEGAYGPVYADPVKVACLVDETRRLVRDSNGDETVSEATITLNPRSHVLDEQGRRTGQMVDALATFTAESTITFPTGCVSRVLSVKANTVRGYTVSVEVTCA